MYDELYRFLIQQKKLNIPNLGTLLVIRKPAEADFLIKYIIPPAFTIILQQELNSPTKKIFSWLAKALNISEREAMVRFNDFAFELKKEIETGNEVLWNGVGTLSHESNGRIKFLSSPIVTVYQPVKAEKMFRENAEHMVRVGEKERTSAEMAELYYNPGKKKIFWWVYALVIGVLTLSFLGWRFLENGINESSAANQQKMLPKQIEPTYNIIH